MNEFEKKMSKGQYIAEQTRRETSSRASRTSINQEETLRQYQSRCESLGTRSAQKVLKKDSMINATMKKRNEKNKLMVT